MRPLATGFICAVLVLINLSCSVNILQTFSDQNSNEALYEDANTLNNASNYNGALAKIGAMTGAYPNLAKVLELKASVYGGLCGFKFIPFVTALSGMGATRLFPFLLQNFDVGLAANMDNCILAQNTMISIGTMAERSADENFFIAAIAFAKIGNILSYYADVAATGAITAGYDPCAVGGGRAKGGAITDADAREIGTGIALAAANLAAVASKVNLGNGSLTAITNLCTTLTGVGMNFCAITDPLAFSATDVKGIRSVVAENSAIGLGSTVSNAPATCPGVVTSCFCP